MSAIEVLKCMIEDRKCFCGCSLENSADTEINALDEAIVALEQKEKLENWCIEKISLCKKTNKYYDLSKSDYYSARIKTLKEVLELMK